MSCVTGPSALVGVTSVSPVTRAATTPIAIASGIATMPAHQGIPKRALISTTAIGPSTAKPKGNQMGGHSTAASGSALAEPPRRLSSPASSWNERATLRLFPNVYAMTVILPADFVRPGEVVAFGTPHPGLFDLGRYPSGRDDTADAIAEQLRAASFVVRFAQQ